MARPLNILVVDANSKAANDSSLALGHKTTGRAYADTLELVAERLGIPVRCVVTTAAPPLPGDATLSDFDGIAWSGSALSIRNGGPEIARQIDMARAAFASGTPVFGSCWGLQVMCAALGGVVRRNPLGREIGFSRHIRLTQAGIAHPMYRDRASPFDAITVHLDEVETLPDGATVLASNWISEIQGLDISDGARSFWGVQYHPEFTLLDIAVIHRRLAGTLVEEGFFKSAGAVHGFADRLAAQHESPNQDVLATAFDVGADVLDTERRTADLRHWLLFKVIPNAGGGGSTAR